MKALPVRADESSVCCWCSLMDAIRLLPAVNPPYSRQSSSSSTSLVPVTRFPLVSQTLAPRSSQPSDGAFSSDHYVWSVSVGDDGSFHFYAVPRQSYVGTTSGQSQSSAAPWAIPQSKNVPAQYAMYASLAAPASGHMIDLYA